MSSLPRQGHYLVIHPARKSIVSRMEQGSEDEKESALVAFVAERALRHGPKPNAIKTIGRIGLELGLKVVDTGRIIKKGEALAERVRGTVIERAVKNGDAATAVALLARESDIDRAVDGVVAGAAEWGGKLTEAGKGRIKSILEREIEKTVRSFNAASLADVERVSIHARAKRATSAATDALTTLTVSIHARAKRATLRQ